MVILYIVISFIVATLCLLETFSKNRYTDGDDDILFIFFALLIGLIWPIAIWVILVKWWASDETPKWVEKIKELLSYAHIVEQSIVRKNILMFL